MPVALAVLSASLLIVSCSDHRTTEFSQEKGEFSVMSFNLNQYGLKDRDQDGQHNDPKPARERKAVEKIIATVQPDILFLQEVGNPGILDRLRSDIAQCGLQYRGLEYIQRGNHENNIALLSKFPIVARESHTNDVYSIGDSSLHVLRGIIDIQLEVSKGYRVRIMGAHLKSKVYHPLGQTEMRRNEARILGQHVRSALKSEPAIRLLVAGDLNDLSNSATLREICGEEDPYLHDLRPVDSSGDAWTSRDNELDVYQRTDYMLANSKLRNDVVMQKTQIVNLPETRLASDHRPILAVFSTSSSD